MKYLKYLVFYSDAVQEEVEFIAARHDPDPVWNILKKTRQDSPFAPVHTRFGRVYEKQTNANGCCFLCQFIHDKMINYGPNLWSAWQAAARARVHKHIMYAVPLKKGRSWNNCMKSSERYQAPKSHPVVRGSLYWCTHSCAQLAVSKLLWDLYCRNALVGNSSPSFIFFVCVTFPLCPPSILASSSLLCPSINGRTLSVLTSSWRLQSHLNRVQVPPGSFFTSHLHLPNLLTGPLTGCVFYCTGKQKKQQH